MSFWTSLKLRLCGRRKVRGYLDPAEIKHAKKLGVSLWEYLENQSGSTGLHERLVREFINPELKGSETILEIGTGAGKVAARLLNLFPDIRYLSFEPDPHLRRYLNEQFADRITSFHTHGSDLRQVSANSIDLVIASGVYTYLDSATIINYLRETSRVLKPGGTAIFNIFDTDDPTGWPIEAAHHYSELDDPRPFLSSSFVARVCESLGMVFESRWKSDPDSGSTYLKFRSRDTARK